MATEIHHGPPGSFKSFTLVQRFAIEALLLGRTIVTNIRGFDSLDLIKDVYPDHDFPSSAQILWVDTRSAEGRLLMACFYKWVPFGAMIIIDEIQQIYPDRRDFKLESLDSFTPHPDDVFNDGMTDDLLKEGRPEDVFTAYDKQRHFNWDILASTTNIAKVKNEIREVTDFAYRHRDLSGIIPWWKNTWTEHQHDPENNGKSKSNTVGTPKRYKADTRIFKCYSSTATGEHVTSPFKRSVFTDPKILGFIVLLGFCAFFFSVISATSDARQPTAPPPGPAPVQAPVEGGHTPSLPDSGGGHPVQTAQSGAVPVPVLKTSLDPLIIRTWSYNGIKPDELPTVPLSCRIAKKTVKCAIARNSTAEFQAVAFAMNKACDNHYCHVVFFINEPQPDTRANPAARFKNPLSTAMLP